MSVQQPKLLDLVRQRIRYKHMSYRTEQAYCGWIKRFVIFHKMRHPRDMGAPEVMAFLTHLAVERNVAASTQNQAKAAILFLYKEVLQQDLPWLDEVVSAKKARRLPVVLTQREVRELLLHLQGTQWLVASLLYGTGMRILEALRLRVKDVEFERRELIVREGKGNKDRVTVLPENLMAPLREQVERKPAEPPQVPPSPKDDPAMREVFEARLEAALATRPEFKDVPFAKHLDMSTFVGNDGRVDREAVAAFFEALPQGAHKTAGTPAGWGSNAPYEGASGIDAGREMFKASRAKN